MDYTYKEMSKMINHSILNPTVTYEDMEKGCLLAVQYDTATVCVMPYALKRCAEILKGSDVKPGTTIGFPHGLNTTAVKVAEVEQALMDGGQELDMVVNISKVLSGDWNFVRKDIQAVAEATHAGGAKIKVIFENCYLNREQKIRLCEICSELKCDWVKTSTGYATSGCTIEDLILMRKHSAPSVQVKAAGGVRDFDTLLKVRATGATRCGATRTKDILDECKKRLGL